VILNALDTPPEIQLLLSEFLALRALVLALNAEALQGSKLTEQRIAAMIQQADAKKYAMAESRIRAFQANGKSGSAEAAKS
jgi:RNA:NAD 2'-phosphotransferase (TPT1/KptA family)